MFLPTLLLVLGPGPVQDLNDPGLRALPFARAPVFAEPNRIALTPLLDGVIEEEEWDLLMQEDYVEGYLQWEPGKLHVAGKLPVGQDLLLSMDVSGDGWLVGKDNLQIRISFDNRPRVSTQVLDATNPHGPVWRPFPSLATASGIVATSDGEDWQFELTLEDPGMGILPTAATKTFMRMDAVDFDWGNPEPFLPRLLAPVRFVTERSGGLLAGLTWKPELRPRVVTPGDSIRVRMNFTGSNELELGRFDLRAEGFARAGSTELGVPFPEFDRRQRAFVDYETRLPKEHPFGFRVVRGVLHGSDGVPTIVQTSFQVAPLLQFDVVQRTFAVREEARVEKVPIYFQSNTGARLNGSYTVRAPAGWRVVSGVDRPFLIYEPRGRARRVFELEIPGGTEGTFPLMVKARMGDQEVEERVWVTVGGQ
jgi:hypothetical protein